MPLARMNRTVGRRTQGCTKRVTSCFVTMFLISAFSAYAADIKGGFIAPSSIRVYRVSFKEWSCADRCEAKVFLQAPNAASGDFGTVATPDAFTLVSSKVLSGSLTHGRGALEQVLVLEAGNYLVSVTCEASSRCFASPNSNVSFHMWGKGKDVDSPDATGASHSRGPLVKRSLVAEFLVDRREPLYDGGDALHNTCHDASESQAERSAGDPEARGSGSYVFGFASPLQLVLAVLVVQLGAVLAVHFGIKL